MSPQKLFCESANEIQYTTEVSLCSDTIKTGSVFTVESVLGKMFYA